MKKSKSQFKIQKISFLLLVFGFTFFPLIAKGAILYLSPSSGEYNRGDIFISKVKLNTEGEAINTCEVNIKFPFDQLEIIDISDGGSILTLWAKTPTFSNKEGTFSFIGGAPGGFNGEGNLLSIIFRVLSPEGLPVFAKVFFQDNSKVLLNDGFGTSAKLTTKSAIFTMAAEKLEVPRDEWQEEIEKDNISPEPFEIEISQNPTIFAGKYFIAFSTIDKQTGIDHYEVAEVARVQPVQIEWKRGKSPYLLEDQSLKSKIFVKAVDKAGNERIAEIMPPVKPFPYWFDKLTTSWIIILVLFGVGIIIYKILKYARLHSRNLFQ